MNAIFGISPRCLLLQRRPELHTRGKHDGLIGVSHRPLVIVILANGCVLPFKKFVESPISLLAGKIRGSVKKTDYYQEYYR